MQKLRDGLSVALRPTTTTVEERWWLLRLDRGFLFDWDGGWPEEVAVDVLADQYAAYNGGVQRTPRGYSTAMGRLLRRVCPEIHSYTRRMGGRRVRFYCGLPSLAEARAAWERVKGKREW